MGSKKITRFIDKIRLRRLESSRVRHPQDWDGYRTVLEEFVPRSMPHKIYLNQLWAEWRRFLDFLVPDIAPKRILEIGTGRAGSTYFFTKIGGEGSVIATIDIEPIASEFVKLYATFPGQKVHALTGHSHSPEIIDAVENIFGGEPLNLLYIDGDHEYDGVKQDYELYRKFCNEHTCISFHDIVPDYGVTKGIKTQSYTGEVYKFWRELKERHKHMELIESADQNGFGIGILPPALNGD